MVSTTSAYLSVTNNLTRLTAATAANTTVKSATDYYLANIGKVKTVADFVGNYRLFSYAMTAFGLSDMTYAKGLMTKLLNEGTTSSSALANQLSDQKYKEFATAFDFAGQGTAATSATSATTDVTAKYVEQSLETNEGKQNQGVQLAMYFKKNASSITSAYGILADTAILKVVDTIYGIPSSAAVQDIDTQYAYLNKIMNIKDLQDPTKVDALVKRFTAQWDSAGNNSSASAANALLVSDTSTSGLSSALMLSISNLKLGGS